MITHELRAHVTASCGFTCSGGVGPNKLLSKLCSGMNKPARQTVCVPSVVPALMQALPVGRLKGFGGKMGEDLARELNVTHVADLLTVKAGMLAMRYGDVRAEWMLAAAAGNDTELVTDRTLSKVISCGKTFRGVNGRDIHYPSPYLCMNRIDLNSYCIRQT